MREILESSPSERTSPTKQSLTKTSSTPLVLITNIVPLKLELQILYRVVVTHALVQTQTLDLLQTRSQAGHGRLARCLAFAIWGRLLRWQRRLGLRLEERPRAALRIDIVAKEPHRKLVVVGQVVDLAPLAAVTLG